MGKITILLSKEVDKKIRERAKKNFRSVSKDCVRSDSVS